MYYAGVMRDPIEVEVHCEDAVNRISDADSRGGHRRAPASIRHVVVRLGETAVRHLEESKTDAATLDRFSTMDVYMSRFSRLQTVVLETSEDTRKSDPLADQLVFLRGSGRLRQRTSEQAQKIALESTDERHPLIARVHDGEAISPLWYAEKYEASRGKW